MRFEDLDVRFGNVVASDVDWRKSPIVNEKDPDDELLPETPVDVVGMLGFDPLDEPE